MKPVLITEVTQYDLPMVEGFLTKYGLLNSYILIHPTALTERMLTMVTRYCLNVLLLTEGVEGTPNCLERIELSSPGLLERIKRVHYSKLFFVVEATNNKISISAALQVAEAYKSHRVMLLRNRCGNSHFYDAEYIYKNIRGEINEADNIELVYNLDNMFRVVDFSLLKDLNIVSANLL